MLAHYCSDCKETAEPEWWNERESTNLVTQTYGTAYPICSYCGSDRVMPIDEIIDAMEIQKGER